MYEAWNGHGIGLHKVELMCGEWAAHGQPFVMFWGLLKIVSGLRELDKNRPCVVA